MCKPPALIPCLALAFQLSSTGMLLGSRDRDRGLFSDLPVEWGSSAPFRESTSLTPCYLPAPREKALWAVG